jgi:hypothetical protein
MRLPILLLFENKMIRKVSVPKKDEGISNLGYYVQNREHLDIYVKLTTVGIMKSMRL